MLSHLDRTGKATKPCMAITRVAGDVAKVIAALAVEEEGAILLPVSIVAVPKG